MLSGCCRNDPSVGEAHVDWIGVDETARGKGIGKALMQFADDYGLAHGCTFITLEVVRGNRAKSLYERGGYEVVPNQKTGCCPACCVNFIACCMTGYCGVHTMHKSLV